MQNTELNAINPAISSSQQSLIYYINSIEQYMIHTTHLNTQLQKQLSILTQHRNKLVQIKARKRQSIKIKMRTIQRDLQQKQNKLKKVKKCLQNRINKTYEQLNKNIQLPIPYYQYQYIINRIPEYIKLISEKIQQIEQNIKKQNIKRQEELRTLKIRISLAQIQLKQLKDRSKRR